MRRVVVTGMGLVSALGNTPSEAFERLKTLKNLISYDEELEKYQGLHSKLSCRIRNFDLRSQFSRKESRTMGPVSIMATYSTKKALEEAKLLGNEVITNGRTGISYGSSSGSIETILDFYSMIKDHEVKNITSATYTKMMPQTTAVNISMFFKTTGRLIPSGTACTSGSLSIGIGFENIKSGIQDVMIVGGAEEFSATQVAIFDTLFATSIKNDASQSTPSPFDRDRDGLVIGEGAGTLILEELEHAKKRGANIFAEVVGFGTNTDGTHITQPNKETIKNALILALENAKISSDKIGYINAHGTATAQGDVAETKATENVFKRLVPISSLKSYIGHSLGACGSMEAILSILMMRDNWYAPTLNLNNVDPNCGALDYIKDSGRQMDNEYIMSNNFAFGGINTSLIFKKYYE